MVTIVNEKGDLLKRLHKADIGSMLKESIERKTRDSEIVVLQRYELLIVEDDVRVSREVNSKEVIESLETWDLSGTSILIVDENNRIIDGMTRFLYSKWDEFKCLRIKHELTKEEAIIINILLNTKRENPNFSEQLKAVKELTALDFDTEAIAKMICKVPKTVKTIQEVHEIDNPYMIEEICKADTSEKRNQESFTLRKFEVGVRSLYKSEIVSNVPKKTKDAIANAAIKVAKYDKRDRMGEDKTGERLAKNASVMHKDYTPKSIVDATFIQSYNSDMICEHPEKFLAFEGILFERNPDFCLVLCAEGAYLYDEHTKNRVTTASWSSTQYCGEDNVALVGLFEGVKEKDIQSLGLNKNKQYFKEDMFQYLSHAKGDNRKGLVFIDSFGTLDFCAKGMFEVLMEKFPNSDIAFIVQDSFNCTRNCEVSNAKNMITLWGTTTIPRNVGEFISVARNSLNRTIDLIWTPKESGQVISMWIISTK